MFFLDCTIFSYYSGHSRHFLFFWPLHLMASSENLLLSPTLGNCKNESSTLDTSLFLHTWQLMPIFSELLWLHSGFNIIGVKTRADQPLKAYDTILYTLPSQSDFIRTRSYLLFRPASQKLSCGCRAVWESQPQIVSILFDVVLWLPYRHLIVDLIWLNWICTWRLDREMNVLRLIVHWNCRT